MTHYSNTKNPADFPREPAPFNEKFIDLAESVGFNTEALAQYAGGFPREDLIVLEDFYIQIVERCAQFVDRAISEGGVDGQSVREHFGIGQ